MGANPGGGIRTHDQGIMSSHATNRKRLENKGVTSHDETAVEQMQKTDTKLPPELRAVIDAWPALPAAIRAGIMAMVSAAK